MIDVDLTGPGFDRQNLHPLPGGQLAVRPGLRKILSPDSGRIFVGGGTVKGAATEEVRHYIVDALNGAAPDVRILMTDEVLSTLQTRSVAASTLPRTVSVSTGLNDLLISSPDFATQHAFIGSGLADAEPVASVDPGDVVRSVPRGLSVSWAGRWVVASGNTLYFSDALAARTFVVENVLIGEWAGRVYGLHVSAEGALIVAAGNGIYAIPEYAAQKQIVEGQWSRLTDVGVNDYETTCTSRGDIYALTRKGLRQAYPSGREILLAQKEITRYHGAPVSSPDFRAGRLIGSQLGPIAAVGNSVHVMDKATDHAAWWNAPNETSFKLRAILHDRYGAELWLCEDGLYAVEGNFDGGEALTSEGATAVTGIYAGRLPTKADQNVVVRETRMGSDTGGLVVMAVQGSNHTSKPRQDGIVIGTDSWDAGKNYTAPHLDKRQKKMNHRTRDVSLEMGATGPLSRVDTRCSLDAAGVGTGRAS